jgi:hypothetical protein
MIIATTRAVERGAGIHPPSIPIGRLYVHIRRAVSRPLVVGRVPPRFGRHVGIFAIVRINRGARVLVLEWWYRLDDVARDEGKRPNDKAG